VHLVSIVDQQVGDVRPVLNRDPRHEGALCHCVSPPSPGRVRTQNLANSGPGVV
jgi:hypothetical protein